ncbi:DUF6176 family protein [Metasolibacillus meyeri]|uniref:DUF6176 family protein n=1 Tax=Metasolibacillus meyeri TaxID=1071052 RepID=A0AAW9NY92_9BACL|nr:DUF6176 family protein [Metasolibacillus meyeri]MEC1180386.1 DUF6176 family protein [Metasolibacillus meyeri]
MLVECTRFKVKEGQSSKVDEWLQFLNDHIPDVLVTLENEKMYVETIFRERTMQGEEYLYWYSVRGEGGMDVEDSEHWIDKQHLAYWDECINKSYHPVDLETAVVMIPAKIQQVMVQK